MDLNKLYQIAKDCEIIIDRTCPRELVAMSFLFPDETMLIGLSDLSCAPLGVTIEQVMAHELGHCLSGTFYNIHTPRSERLPYERTADEWAIELIMPLSEIVEARARNVQSVKELSQYFRVSREFVRKALAYHGT